MLRRWRQKLRKSDADGMRRVGALVGETLAYIAHFIEPGVTTNQIDKLVHSFTLKNRATPAPLGYKGFPKSVCTSVNDCMCHGVPDNRPLLEGDLVNIDITSILDGYYGDASFTFPVGKTSKANLELCLAAKGARDAGIASIRPGYRTGLIGETTESFIKQTPFYICREIGGHGIGKVFHGEPFIPAFGHKDEGPKLKPWSCITVEPIVNMSDNQSVAHHIPGSKVRYYRTSDGTNSAQFEHTILITDQGCEILTLWDDEPFLSIQDT